MNQHLIVVSVDAMVYEDLEFLLKLPNTGKLMQNGSMVKRVKTIYPSVTHAVHATLMSGCTPEKTGIINNEIFIPGQLSTPWFNRLEEMQCDTLFHAAKRAHLTTCACRWPVIAGGFDVIDYLVPEVLGTDEQLEPDAEKRFRAAVSPCLFEDCVRPHLPLMEQSPRHPRDDHFSNACACDILRKYKPNLLMTHPGTVDAFRHQFGLFGDAVHEALKLTDDWIGQLMQAADDAGIAQNTSWCITSDHGQLNVQRRIALNVLFRDRGWISTDSEGRVTDWKVWAHSAGLSAHIYVKHKEMEEEVYAALQEMAAEGIFGFYEVLTAQQTRERYGLFGPFSFVVETDGFTAFHGSWERPLVRPMDLSDYRYSHGSHGHMPEKGPQPPLLVCGPAFAKNVVIETATILDEAPTFAAALGLELPQAEGQPIKELLAR